MAKIAEAPPAAKGREPPCESALLFRKPLLLLHESSRRDVHFDIASGRDHVHCCNDVFDMQTKDRPLRIAKHNDGDLATCEVLLVPNVFICGQNDLKPSLLRFR